MSKMPFALRFAQRADKTVNVGKLEHSDKIGGLVQMTDEELRSVSGGEGETDGGDPNRLSFLKRTSEATFGNPNGNPDGTDTLTDFTVIDIHIA